MDTFHAIMLGLYGVIFGELFWGSIFVLGLIFGWWEKIINKILDWQEK